VSGVTPVGTRLRWLRKAISRATGSRPLHNKATTLAPETGSPRHKGGAMAGIEVAFIVIAPYPRRHARLSEILSITGLPEQKIDDSDLQTFR
jgi:hypothetical protein